MLFIFIDQIIEAFSTDVTFLYAIDGVHDKVMSVPNEY